MDIHDTPIHLTFGKTLSRILDNHSHFIREIIQALREFPFMREDDFLSEMVAVNKNIGCRICL